MAIELLKQEFLTDVTLKKYIFLFYGSTALVDLGTLVVEPSLLHSDTSHSDFSGRVISASQRPPPDKTQHSQETYFHVYRGIRTHNPSKHVVVNGIPLSVFNTT